MRDVIFNALGMNGGSKRLYQISESQVTEAEFEAAALIHNVVFGKDGLTEFLGPTWDLVNDPRFIAIEECFIFERGSVFGGDAGMGKLIITDQGVFGSGATASLEEYSVVLGEGRHFMETVRSEAWQNKVAGVTVTDDSGLCPSWSLSKPEDVKSWTDHWIWELIKQECPNYFTRNNEPNRDATALYRLFKADLLGLISDYSQMATSADWIRIDSRGVVDPTDWKEEVPIVHVEVYNLEAALNFRAELRGTAFRVLNNTPGMKELLADMDFTETERDDLLKMIFRTPYREHYKLPGLVREWVYTLKNVPVNIREAAQLGAAKANAAAILAKLKSGELQPVKTDITDDAAASVEMNDGEKDVLALLEDPIRMAAFEMIVALDNRGVDASAFQHLLEVEVITEDMLEPLRAAFSAPVPSTTVEEPNA